MADEMETDCKMASKVEEDEAKKSGKGIVVILIGAPGSGKSTFCEDVMKTARRPWARVCQDTISKGKAGTKAQCLKSAVDALKDRKSVFIDRCNLEREQRNEFVKLGGSEVDMHAVVLDLPARLCISRSVKRTGHEGNLQGGKAAAVVNRMLQKKEVPKLSEGFSRITFCQNESDVQGAVDTYTALGPLDTLPSGCFGQKNPDSKIQLGIMKFMKKVDPNIQKSDTSSPADSTSKQESKDSSTKESESNTFSSEAADKNAKTDGELQKDSSCCGASLCDPTLAFPSISTADFRFNIEKASDIIVDEVEKFLTKVKNLRLVLVDLTHGSKILPLVKEKSKQKNINSNKFFTFVGDITQLYTQGGLRCNVIANAANWRLKPGGGGVNAAIFNAAGPSLEIATNERAGSLLPGNALVVPLPSLSPLYKKEGVTHVIHVVGPNMNPHRPNFLNNDYDKGCKVLRDAYSSLFEGFASVLGTYTTEENGGGYNSERESSVPNAKPSERSPADCLQNKEQKIKREAAYESESNKKCKGFGDEHYVVPESDEKASLVCSTDAPKRKVQLTKDKNNSGTTKSRGSWALALYHIAMHPEKHKNDVIEISDDVVVLNDIYAKAKRHLLVIARKEGLDRLEDVGKEHLQLLRTMHSVGAKWATKFSSDDSSLIFRLGYHSEPSMRQLHLHVISQDFNSTHLKNKKHWNSFNSIFFRDSAEVMEEIMKHGKAKLNDDEKLLSMELRCHRCRSAHPNIPRLKSHIANCQASFSATLLQDGYLIPPSTAVRTEV